MKNFPSFLIAALLVSFSLNMQANLSSSVDPPKFIEDEAELIYDNDFVSYKISKSDLGALIAQTDYNDNNQYFSIKTFKKISYIQVFSEAGELEYQLPIFSDMVHLSLKKFKGKSYEINLLFEEEDEYLSSKLSIK